VKHSIISWDCCYRNFFHTAFAIADQNFDMGLVEVIYVEQRTKAASDRYNRQAGLPSLGDVVAALQDRLNIRAIYLGDRSSEPFHWGKAVNLGIQASSGEIVSVMDGDLLVDRDFLSKLAQEHLRSATAIVNLHRRMVPEPIGVPRSRWTEQVIAFDRCLNACPDRDQALPVTVQNYGPLISTRREHWDSISGYDDHRIWSTGLSLLGTDVTTRLEIALDARSHLLPDTVCVHPWHPVGFRRDTFAARGMLSLQEELLEWTRSKGVSDWRIRLPVTNRLYAANARVVERVIKSGIAEPSVQQTASSRVQAWLSATAAHLLHREFSQLRGSLAGVLRKILATHR
jgi:hypothetical protein